MTPTKRLSRWLAYLAVLGPGMLAASAGNDAGGIATYAQAGAAYKYDLLWLLLLITFPLVAVLEMCVRMGAVTRKGLSDLIRENFGVRWTAFAMLALLVANFVVATADIAGVAAALEIVHISPFISVPVISVALWLLLTRGSYITVEKGLLIFAGLFLAYPIAAFTVNPNWGQVFHAMLVPSKDWVGGFNLGYIQLAIGLIGTTIAPWMTFYLQASIVDKGVRKQDLPLRRFDVVSGAISADVIAFFIIVTTAVLFTSFGAVQFQDAGDAAAALQQFVHGAAPYLFGAGLFGASVLGAAAVPLTTSYAITEAFGWERGLDHRFREAPVFFGLLTGIIGLGAVTVLITIMLHEKLIRLILFSQVINGILVPIILVFIVLLSNNRRLMGEYTNSRIYNIIAWGTVVLITLMTVLYFGLALFGGK